MLKARRLPLLIAVVLAFSLLPMAAHGQEDAAACSADTAPAPFTDRSSIPDAHGSSVDCAYANGIAQGFSDNTYRPATPVLRDGMASFIARTLDAAGVDLPDPAQDRFTDVAAGSAHDEPVHRLKAAGIVGGGPGGLPASQYGPRLAVRRDQMASFLVRALEFALDQELGSDNQRFPDVGAGNPHFANVNAASEQGLARGRVDGRYGPGEAVRRDQMASFLVRALETFSSGTVAASIGETGPPPAPSGVEAHNESSAAEGRVRVVWNPLGDPHGRLSGYNVYYGEGETNVHAGSGTTTVDSDATSFTVGGLGLNVTYTFAVTAVTSDGAESQKSAEVTAVTVPPSVRITEPTSQEPVAVGPSDTVQVSFEADTTDGGTYQVSYREHGAAEGAEWTPFPETPADTPGQIPAGAGTKTRTVTAPSETDTYDLRVVVTPTDGTASIQDVASGALQVVREPGDPTVEITRPTSAAPAEVDQGGKVDVTFTASHDGEYELERRQSGQDPPADWEKFDDVDAEGSASEGQTTVAVTAPSSDGSYDLRVRLTTAGDKTAQNVQGQAIVVGEENGGNGGDPGNGEPNCDEDPDHPDCPGNGEPPPPPPPGGGTQFYFHGGGTDEVTVIAVDGGTFSQEEPAGGSVVQYSSGLGSHAAGQAVHAGAGHPLAASWTGSFSGQVSGQLSVTGWFQGVDGTYVKIQVYADGERIDVGDTFNAGQSQNGYGVLRMEPDAPVQNTLTVAVSGTVTSSLVVQLVSGPAAVSPQSREFAIWYGSAEMPSGFRLPG
jgi:hypothetical protein